MINEEYLEPETIRALRGQDLSSLEVLKDLAENVIKRTVAPFTDFYVFENIVHVLNNIEPNVETSEGCLPEHIWYALERSKEILGEYPELDDEVEMYIRFMFREEGISFKHPAMDMSNEEVLHLELVKKRSEGPYPIIESDDPLDMQAIKYLRIMEYLNANRSV